MYKNMISWRNEMVTQKAKRPVPILSFPGAKLLGVTVEELVKDGHLQALCMKSIAERYEMGIALSLMDLSVEAEAFGSPVYYSRDEVPTVRTALIHDAQEAEALKIPEIGNGRTGECIRGIREAKEMITDRPVFAGIIGPYSLAGRLLDMTEIMILCYEEPELVECILEKVTKFLVSYAKAFKEAGADGIIMAEPAAGLLSPTLVDEFSTPYVKNIMEAVEDENFLVIYHNCGNVIPMLEQMRQIGAGAYSFGNAIDLEEALKILPEDCMVLGNLDPTGVLRNGSPQTVKEETKKLLSRCSQYPHFVISSGCDIPPTTPLENMDAFFEAVKEFYASI